jgi:hypothetical protein
MTWFQITIHQRRYYGYGTVHFPNLILLRSSSDGLTLATVAALAGAASNPAGIVILGVGSIVWIAKWLFDVYQNRCVSRSWTRCTFPA